MGSIAMQTKKPIIPPALSSPRSDARSTAVDAVAASSSSAAVIMRAAIVQMSQR